MSIANYSELQSAITDLFKRTDKTAKYPDYISLAEQTIIRQLKLRVNEATSTGTTSGNTITIPAGCARILRVRIETGNVEYMLDYASPNGIERYTIGTSLPSLYTVEGGAIRLLSAPSGPYGYTLFYVPDLTPLSDTNTTNWALLNAPDVYLYGSVMQAFLAAWDDPNAMKFQVLFDNAMQSVKSVDEARRLPLAGGLQIKPRGFR